MNKSDKIHLLSKQLVVHTLKPHKNWAKIAEIANEIKVRALLLKENPSK